MYLLILFLPLFSSFVAGFFGRFLKIKGVGFFSISCLLFTFILSLAGLYEIGFSNCNAYVKLLSWLDVEMFDACFGFCFDSLSICMCCLVSFISLLVHIYSTSYMSHDMHQPRFMSYLSLFTFFMLMLITADNFLQLFLGWEGVGLCSYLLINFWFTRIQANKAAIKAMVVNRIGDFGLALGIFTIFSVFKSIDFAVIFSTTHYHNNKIISFLNFDCHCLTIIGLLLLIGSMGKSAQLGLHTWLPDAMEGPTPVSALIHAATMVTAGVYLIIRCSPIYEQSSVALCVITYVGAATAFFAGTIGVVQNDLKKVIAYSTCSQLGYMIFSCGLSNYSIGMFHLLNHAYFKALLFLSAGAIIHALSDEQDMRRMGGLVKVLPYSYVMILIGSLALVGFPFLTGFYSKDSILETAFSKYSFEGNFALWLGFISAGFTSFYSIRLIYLTFLNQSNGHKNYVAAAKDAPFVMSFVLTCLSVGSIFIGYLTKDLLIGVGTPFWNNSIYYLPVNFSGIDAEFIPRFIKWLPFFITIISGVLACIIYARFKLHVYKICEIAIFYNVYSFFNRKWFVDKFYNKGFVNILLHIGYNSTYKIIDKGFIEFFGPKSISNNATNAAQQFVLLQSGLLNQYTFCMFVAVILSLICLLYDVLFLYFQINGFSILFLATLFFYYKKL